MRGRAAARHFDKTYWITPYTKSGYSPEQGYNRSDYIHGALAAVLTELYGTVGKWLEAGCAFGWLVEQLMVLGVDAYGFDISKYSTKNAPELVNGRVSCHDGLSSKRHLVDEYDVVYSFETAEHVYMDDVPLWLDNLGVWAKPGAKLFMTICLGNDNYRGLNDPDESHQTLQPRQWWDEKLRQAGFVPEDGTLERARQIEVQTERMPAPQNLALHYKWHAFAYVRV